jgi:hypothetical protein
MKDGCPTLYPFFPFVGSAPLFLSGSAPTRETVGKISNATLAPMRLLFFPSRPVGSSSPNRKSRFFPFKKRKEKDLKLDTKMIDRRQEKKKKMGMECEQSDR